MPKPTTTKKGSADPAVPPNNRLARRLLAYVADCDHRVSPSELERYLVRISEQSRPDCRRRIRQLVASGELAYTYEFGSSYLEPSFHKPVPLSKRLIRIPPDSKFSAPEGTAALRLNPGAAFGCGRHSSTRLALRAVEKVCDGMGPIESVLDVGTGSGVLVIAALQLGARRGLGIDIDACARVEAAENVRINGLAAQIRIRDDAVEALAGCGDHYDLVIANLRPPTLLRLRTALTTLVEAQGFLVVSGIREEESEPLLRNYEETGLHRIWTAGEKGWRALVLAARR